MKIISTGAQRPVIPNTGSNEAAIKAKAVAAFKAASPTAEQPNQQPPTQVVHNQNAVSAEEVGAIMAIPQPNIDTSTPVEDTETAVTPPSPIEETQLSAKFAQLAKREAQARKERQRRDQELKQREEALKQREEALSKSPQFDPNEYVSKAKLKAQTLEALAEADISYDEIVQQALNQPNQDPRTTALISKMEAKVAALQSKLEAQEKSVLEQQQQGYDAAIRQIKMDATNLVKSDPNFETIKATNSIKDVVDLIERTYKEDGVVLSVEEAAQQVEDYLVEEGTKLAKLQKIQAKLKASQVAPKTPQAPVQTQPTQQQKQPMKTLTNATGSTRQLSAKERAILAFQGQLK